MKKALTLIELIFTIVILSFIFTVIPKIIYISNKTLDFSKKQDAIFNMMAKIMDISLKEFDENNTPTTVNLYADVSYNDILLVNNPPKYVLDCNASSGYRVGGFTGSRNCFHKKYVSHIGIDLNDIYPDDVDDYNSSPYNEENTTTSGHTVYTLEIRVGYTNEWHKNNYDYKKGILEYKFTKNMNLAKSNIKRIYIRVFQKDTNISSVSYYSANIGHIRIKDVSW